MEHIAGFLVCATIIFFAGRKLSRLGDRLAVLKGWSKAWVGLILMATVTSLPELMVGVSSAAIVRSADLAVGDILGSCAFNLGILALMDAFVPRRKHLFEMASPSHVLSAGLSLILLAMAGMGLFLPAEFSISTVMGLTSVLFIVIYLASVRLIYRYQLTQKSPTEEMAPQEEGQPAMRKVATLFTVFALIIIAAALALPYFADHIAEMVGFSDSFAGTLFLAVSTSLPEIAVSIAAVRMGSIDLAVGGLLGSNLFNILILAIDDIMYPGGLLLKDASDINTISAFSTIIMTSIVIIGLTYRAKGKRYFLAWDSALIFLVYILNLVLLYRFGH